MDDPATCPLCGRANHCAIADGRSTCWCYTARVPDALLARVPEEDRLRRCVCEACIEDSRQQLPTVG